MAYILKDEIGNYFKKIYDSIEKRQLLLCVILYRSEGERKKESEGETCRQVAVKGKERKVALGQMCMIDVYSKQSFYE